MAYEILSNKHTVHNYTHDLELLFYVILYMCVMFLSPRGYQKTEGGMPRFLENWLNFKNKEVDLGRDKLGLICYGSELFHKNVSKYLTRYMADLVPCVLKMKEALKNKEREKITHDL